MSPTRGEVLISRFLGPEALGRGPFGLLGLEPAACTPTAVEAALERQLDRIAQHPEADTSEADEVRLVLDTAASELLDPVSRARWIDEIRRSAPPPAAAEPAPLELEPDDPQPDPAPRTPAPDPPPAPAARVRDEFAPAFDHPDEGDRAVKRMLTYAGVALAAMVVILMAGVWLVSALGRGPAPAAPGQGPATSPSSATAPSAPPGNPTAAASPTPAAEPVPPPLPALRARGRSEFADGAQMVRELRLAASELDKDPERGLSRFERAYAVTADWWCRYDQPTQRAAADAVVECLYKASARPEHVDHLLAFITEPAAALEAGDRPIGPDEVWPAAWSAGVLARAAREHDLPPQTAAVLGRAMATSLGAARPTGELSLDTGTLAGLRVLPMAILAGKPPAGAGAADATRAASAAIARWIEGVKETTRADPDKQERQLVEALGVILASAPEADADPRVFDDIGQLAAEIKWRAGGPARARLMDWFRDPAISATDLRTLTSAIATRSSAEGVTPAMVLSTAATADDRAQLRDRYAAAWGLAEASAREDSARDWSERARALLQAPPRDDELDQLAQSADLAEINREAVKIWRGQSAAPAPPAAPPASAGLPGGRKAAGVDPNGVALGSLTGGGADGAWAERFLAAERNIPVRLERLAELDNAGAPIGWIDAGVLAETACFASPVQVRTAAQKIVGKLADEPAMVSALLDALPSAPRIRSVSDMYARAGLVSLPRAGDADWELLARRALVERLLAMIADDGIHGHIEELASRISAAYLDAAGETPTGGGTDASAIGARRGAELLVEAVRREVQGLPVQRATRFDIDQATRRTQQRRAQASGPVQQFVAEQAGLAEALACLVAAERPEREARAADILEQMHRDRRRARHVFAQIWAAERAITRLWMLRMGLQEGSA